MKFSSFFLALFAVAYGADITEFIGLSDAQLASSENTAESAQTILQILNGELQKASTDSQFTTEFLSNYIIDVDAQINAILNGLTSSTAQYSGDISKAISAAVITPYYNETVKGAQTLVDNLAKISASVDPAVAAGIVVNYQRLADFATYNGVDATQLQSLNQKIADHFGASTTGLAKRATNADMSGATGAVNNFRETLDTLMHEVTNDRGHAATATITAIITGLDGQVDNLAATIFNVLDTATFGLTSPLGDFLLGPIFQGMTNGAQVLISNIIGGGIDMVADGTASLFAGTMSKLIELGKKTNVQMHNIAMLEDVHKQWVSLNTIINKNGTHAAKVLEAEIQPNLTAAIADSTIPGGASITPILQAQAQANAKVTSAEFEAAVATAN